VAKQELREYQRGRQDADRARQRFERRQARLESKKNERKHELQEQVGVLTEAPAQTIEALMARVKSKQDE
jgi:Na+-translocating ferredoxin:NAD+ oxidoreductase RnfC subunit